MLVLGKARVVRADVARMVEVDAALAGRRRRRPVASLSAGTRVRERASARSRSAMSFSTRRLVALAARAAGRDPAQQRAAASGLRQRLDAEASRSVSTRHRRSRRLRRSAVEQRSRRRRGRPCPRRCAACRRRCGSRPAARSERAPSTRTRAGRPASPRRRRAAVPPRPRAPRRVAGRHDRRRPRPRTAWWRSSAAVMSSGTHLEPAADDGLVGASEDPHEPVAVDPREIRRADPAGRPELAGPHLEQSFGVDAAAAHRWPAPPPAARNRRGRGRRSPAWSPRTRGGPRCSIPRRRHRTPSPHTTPAQARRTSQ